VTGGSADEGLGADALRWLRELNDIRDGLRRLATVHIKDSEAPFLTAMALLDVTFRPPFIDEGADGLSKIDVGMRLHAVHNLLAGWELLQIGLPDAAAMHVRTAIEAPVYLRAASYDDEFAYAWDAGTARVTHAFRVLRRHSHAEARAMLKAVEPVHRAHQDLSHLSAPVSSLAAPRVGGRGRFIAPQGFLHGPLTEDLARRFAAAAVLVLIEVVRVAHGVDGKWEAAVGTFLDSLPRDGEE